MCGTWSQRLKSSPSSRARGRSCPGLSARLLEQNVAIALGVFRSPRGESPSEESLLCPRFKCLGRKLIGAACSGVHSRSSQLGPGLGSLQPVTQSVGAPRKVAGVQGLPVEPPLGRGGGASVSQHTASTCRASASMLSSEASEGNSSSTSICRGDRVDLYPVEGTCFLLCDKCPVDGTGCS